MRTLLLLTFLLTLGGSIIASPPAFCATHTVENELYRFKINLDSDSGLVTATAERFPTFPPDDLTLVLLSDHTTGESVRLAAVAPYGPKPRYEGQLNPLGGSYFGVGLRFTRGNNEILLLPHPTRKQRLSPQAE